MQITFITSNPEKAGYLSEYLDYEIAHQSLDIHEIQSLSIEEVATHKAREAYTRIGSPVLVEDTGLTISALGALPGPLVKWFLEAIGNKGILSLIKDVSDRSATAEVCFALCDAQGVKLFSGKVEGTIAHEVRGADGFGWNPIFIPNGHTETWGEMDPRAQRAMSMRRSALTKLHNYLQKQ